VKVRNLCDLFGGQRAFARVCKVDERDVRRLCKENAESRPAWEERILKGIDGKIKELKEARKNYT